MNRTIGICSLVIAAGAVVAVAACQPSWLNDDNDFLKGFVNHEFLNILGVILAITLASTAQIHLWFNRIEERNGRRILNASRKELASSAYWLISLFLFGIILVVVKPHMSGPHITALMNGAAIWILLFDAIIMWDITATIFNLGPDLPDDDTSQ